MKFAQSTRPILQLAAAAESLEITSQTHSGQPRTRLNNDWARSEKCQSTLSNLFVSFSSAATKHSEHITPSCLFGVKCTYRKYKYKSGISQSITKTAHVRESKPIVLAVS